MNLEYFIERLSTNRQVFEGLVQEASLEQTRWKPSLGKWSILEVINHLYDEEREDFRQRLDLVLANPEQIWPRIDPQDWVTSRGYIERDLATSLNNFLTEREKSLSWLKQLEKPNWQNRYEHSDGRAITAGDLLASWFGSRLPSHSTIGKAALAVCRHNRGSLPNDLRRTLERVLRVLGPGSCS